MPLAVWPKTSSNWYLQALYASLAAVRFNVQFDGPPLTNAFLREHAAEISAYHFHWPESIWRSRKERTLVERSRMIVGMWRFLRLARRLGIPVVTWIHNIRRHEDADWLDAFGMRLFGHFSRLTVVHSESAREEAGRVLKIEPARTVLMRLGAVAISAPSPGVRATTLDTLQLSPSRRTLLCFGLIRSYKGVDVAIDAVAPLGESYQLIVVGEVFDRALLDSLQVRAAGMAHIRIIPERVSDQRLADLLETCDAVLLPYRRVTGSGVIVTAAQAGRGVIAADLPYFRETLNLEPGAGELFAAGDAAALREAIAAFFRVPAERRRAAAVRLAERHSWSRVIEPLAERLRTLDRT